jgi:ankyrin repeat protein
MVKLIIIFSYLAGEKMSDDYEDNFVFEPLVFDDAFFEKLFFENSKEGKQKALNDKLIVAVKYGDIEQIKKLIDDGAQVNAFDEHENTPLLQSMTEAGRTLIWWTRRV